MKNDFSYASVSKDDGLSLAMDRRRFLQCAVGAGAMAGLRGSALGLMQNNAGAQSDSLLPDGTLFTSWEQPLTYSKTYYVDKNPVQDWVMLFTSSDHRGGIHLETDPLDTRLLARNSAGQAKVNFLATDKRKDPSSVPANEPLWSNTVSFTF